MPVILTIQNKNNNHKLIFQVYDIYNQSGFGLIILIFFFSLIFMGGLTGILESFILDKLTPNHVIIFSQLGQIPSDLINFKGYKFWPILFIVILQIFSLLFFLEIFEYNFCSLNKNTQKNILKRQELIDYDFDKDEEIEVGRGYTLKHIEMEEKFEKKEEDD